MGRYQLVQRCRPLGDYRVPQVLEFLQQAQSMFGISTFVSPEFAVETESLSERSLQQLLDQARQKAPSPTAGVDLDIHGAVGNTGDLIRFELHCGTHPDGIFVDFFNLDFGRNGPTPTPALVRIGVEALLPFEAFVAELNNEHTMRAYARQNAIPGFSRPAIIRWIHYLDATLVDSVGGVSRCMSAPVAAVHEIQDGILIQLTFDPFDPENQEHLAIQQNAIRHLGLT
jgi:hypothetical protein